jgi:carotenoid cleavage dioxygenase
LLPAFGFAIKAKRQTKNSDSVNTANTSVIVHGDKLLALWEGGSAYALDPATLETHPGRRQARAESSAIFGAPESGSG